MKTFNISETKKLFSTLLTNVEHGESFIIAKSGRPIAKLVPFEQPSNKKRAVGFLKGKIKLPENFDVLHQDKIIQVFEGN